VCTSNGISGRLNFPRRAVTSYYTAMTRKEWNRFADGIEAAIEDRLPGCEIHILKADGGTTTLAGSRKRPCETIFSGPAASTMGAMALSTEPVNSVVVDIGGTTSDICLLIEGRPLYASKGATIGGHLTHVNSFAVHSVALGGDSLLHEEGGDLTIGPLRVGPAACFGGERPTVTDAFNVLMDLKIADAGASKAKIESLASTMGQDALELCRTVAQRVTATLKENIRLMFTEWENEPAYKVWEVVHKRKFVLHRVIGIGAAAPAIIPALAGELGVDHFLHRYSPVANALGAAMARPTLTMEVHVDTQKRTYSGAPGGFSGPVKEKDFQSKDALKLARMCLAELARRRGLSVYSADAQVYLDEQFNMIRGVALSGKLFDVGIQITPGFIEEFKGVAG
jgi:N-methylhydantoinase A